MKHAFCICMALAMGLCAFCAQKMTAEELDRLVDQYVQCEHSDFVRISIDELKAAGRLTEPELAEAFYRGISRFTGQKEHARSLRPCLNWFKETASDQQIGRLRDLALSRDGDFGRHAVWLYFDRVVGRPESLTFLDAVLGANPSLHGAVWGALFPYVWGHGSRKLKPEYMRQVLDFVDKKAEEPRNAWPCDDILCQALSGYATSGKRKDRIGRILGTAGIEKIPQARDHFLQELKKLGKLIK